MSSEGWEIYISATRGGGTIRYQGIVHNVDRLKSTNTVVTLTLTVRLLSRNPLNMDHKLAPVASLHLTLAVLESSSHDHNLITLPDGERSDLTA